MDRLFLKPHCVGLSLLLVSSIHDNLVLTIFSTTFPTQDSREMGLYDSGFARSFTCFRIGTIRECFQLFGISVVG